MIEVKVDSILASMMSDHRLLILKEVDGGRYLPVWIGRYEADSIAIGLRDVAVPRPMPHDLLGSTIAALGGSVSRIEIYDLVHDTFYAYIIIELGDKVLKIDSRPSDAIGLAVRVNAPILVEEEIMAEASVILEADITEEGDTALAAFRDFVNTLDLDDLTV